MPTGGPRDKTPPELVESTPYANQKNYNAKTLELTFNEDIKLKDPKEEILIIPALGKKTLFTVKKRKLIITPELPWLPNTTYSINFREGVQDLTEGNPAENLRLAFSTGPTIDSLFISGSVHELFTEKVPQKITVALYESDTFDIYKHTPQYFTKSDKEGNFDISNLKSSKYFIYAFEDKNKNLKVDSKTEKFGYLSTPVNLLEESQDSIKIFLQHVDARPLVLTNIRHTDKTSRVRFNKAIDSLAIKGLSNKQAIYTYGTDQTELIFYNAFSKGDSIPITLIAKDSVGQKVDTLLYLKYGEIKTTPETLKSKELDLNYNFSEKMLTYVLSYNKPIAAINTDSIFIEYDTIKTTSVPLTDILLDTLHNKVVIKTAIEEIQFDEKEKKKPKSPELIIGRAAFVTIENDSSKRVTKTIKIPKVEDLGIVSIKVETKLKNYIVQLTTTDNQVIESLSNIKDHTFKNLTPREYRIRVINDTNQNGIWDSGNFYKGVEPEKVILYKSDDDKYTFPLRANWEVGPLLIKF
jgi:uncharacterized protein (DUF2141 family)